MSAESGDDAEDHERQSTDVPPEDSADNFCGLQPDERNQSTACSVRSTDSEEEERGPVSLAPLEGALECVNDVNHEASDASDDRGACEQVRESPAPQTHRPGQTSKRSNGAKSRRETRFTIPPEHGPASAVRRRDDHCPCLPRR